MSEFNLPYEEHARCFRCSACDMKIHEDYFNLPNRKCNNCCSIYKEKTTIREDDGYGIYNRCEEKIIIKDEGECGGGDRCGEKIIIKENDGCGEKIIIKESDGCGEKIIIKENRCGENRCGENRCGENRCGENRCRDKCNKPDEKIIIKENCRCNKCNARNDTRVISEEKIIIRENYGCNGPLPCERRNRCANSNFRSSNRSERCLGCYNVYRVDELFRNYCEGCRDRFIR